MAGQYLSWKFVSTEYLAANIIWRCHLETEQNRARDRVYLYVYKQM